MEAKHAAQYIRMSTDTQDLSPSVQKDAIAAYASARQLEIVATYEDEGRSGIHLKNRPGLLRLRRQRYRSFRHPIRRDPRIFAGRHGRSRQARFRS